MKSLQDKPMGRIVDIFSLISQTAGLFSLGVVIVAAIFFAVKSDVFKTTSGAQGNAISALQASMEVKDEEITRLNQKITHLELTIDTIFAALKRKGLIISIQGEMINIEDKRGQHSTTTRIRRVAASPATNGQDDAEK